MYDCQEPTYVGLPTTKERLIYTESRFLTEVMKDVKNKNTGSELSTQIMRSKRVLMVLQIVLKVLLDVLAD